MNTKTVKLTLEGDPATVEEITARLRHLFTVTYESKNSRIAQAAEPRVRRYLRLQPPGHLNQPEDRSSL